MPPQAAPPLRGFPEVIRGWRIRCKGKCRTPGCGLTTSIRLGNVLPRRFFNTDQLDAFIRELLDGRSIKNAWERSGLPMSLDTAYRLWRRLILCQSALRTRLSGRSPPPKAKAGVPLLHVLAHLKEVFRAGNAIDFLVKIRRLAFSEAMELLTNIQRERIGQN